MLEVVMIAGALALWCVSGFLVIRRLLLGSPNKETQPSRKTGPCSKDWQAWLKSGGHGADYDRRKDRR